MDPGFHCVFFFFFLNIILSCVVCASVVARCMVVWCMARTRVCVCVCGELKSGSSYSVCTSFIRFNEIVLIAAWTASDLDSWNSMES